MIECEHHGLPIFEQIRAEPKKNDEPDKAARSITRVPVERSGQFWFSVG